MRVIMLAAAATTKRDVEFGTAASELEMDIALRVSEGNDNGGDELNRK